MTFKDYKHQRPDINQVTDQMQKLIEDFNAAKTFEIQDSVMESINEIRRDFDTMDSLVNIRHTIDTTDEYYEKENDYMDDIRPVYEGLVSDYYKALASSEFKNELELKWGSYIFDVAKTRIKTFSDEIVEDMKTENKLASEYTKLRASAKIHFEGQERNLSQMTPFMQSPDRGTRKAAHEAFNDFFEENEDKFDTIYDSLVKIRHQIAVKLGYENFIELGYARLTRTDYDENMVANYRKQVYETLVPAAEKLRTRQQRRLSIDDMRYFDESLQFLNGNANPKGDAQWIMNNAKTMYSELSKETDEFFSYMTDNELLDLEAKKGKAGGGYCTFLPSYKSPFIFSNFNGTSGDVDVLTHEAGHAFQVYESRNYKLPEYVWPTLEACEIHSMSMEFFAWPWMNLFFKEDEQKYKFSHLSGSVLFIPYGVTVDEFQHYVYKNPEATPAQRKSKWREIEKKYLPSRDYENSDFLERGGYFFRQGHIFSNPFYYIDYTLAQVCALEFWTKLQEDKEKAWEDYLRLCKAGGSDSFLSLVKLADLRNPFEDGAIKSIMPAIEKYLDDVDDTKL